MSNNCLAGFPAFGPRVDTSITYHPTQTILETPLDLPTSEPGTAQVQIAIAAGHLPTFSPYQIPWSDGLAETSKYGITLVAICKNESGASRTIYAKSKTANTPTWSSASSQITNNNYYAGFSSAGISAWSIGDTEEIKLYASDVGCKLIGYGMIITPTLIGSGIGKSLVALEIDSASAGFFSGWDGYLQDTNKNLMLQFAFASTTYAITSGVKSTQLKAHEPNSVLGILTTGGISNGFRVNTTPAYGFKVYPTRIAYTPIL